jgi:hypothetical protein
MSSFQDGYYFSSADANMLQRKGDGYGILTGFSTSAVTASLAVVVSPGSARVGDASSYSVKSTFVTSTVSLTSDETYPRRAVIYIDGAGSISALMGTPASALPVGKIGKEAQYPLSPTISDTSVLLSEAWIPAGATIGTSLTLYNSGKINTDFKKPLTYAFYCGVEPARIEELICLAVVDRTEAEMYTQSADDASISWKRKGAVLLPLDTWEELGMGEPSCLYENGRFKMWYRGGMSATGTGVGYAESDDGIIWYRYTGNPLWQGGRGRPYVMKSGSAYWLYCVSVGAPFNYYLYTGTTEYSLASAGVMFTTGTTGQWDNAALGNLCVWQEDSTHWYLLYEAYKAGTQWKIGLATSSDGKAWTKYASNPVIDRGANCAGGPYCLKYNSKYYCWYQGSTNSSAYPTQLYRAESTDLHTWTNETLVLNRQNLYEASQVADVSIVFNITASI